METAPTMNSAALLLVLGVAAVGVLHTIVPDHWAPISLIARQRGWTRRQAARAAAGAGLGHSLSTLLIAILVWTAGVALAARAAHLASTIASIALVGFGLWIAISAWRELRAESGHGHHHHHGFDHDDDARAHVHDEDHDHGENHDHDEHDEHHDHDAHEHFGHRHTHVHERAGATATATAAATPALDSPHQHWHAHHAEDWHTIDAAALAPPLHDHDHKTKSRTALLLILGSSPMVEGIPAFFAAAKFGWPLLALMSLVFTVSTVVTYVALVVVSVAGLERVELGPLERYGEVLSGAFVALIGFAFFFIPI